MAFFWLCGVSLNPPSVSDRRKSSVTSHCLRSLLRILLAVIVGCLPPFKSLFRDRKALTRRNTPAYDYDPSHPMFRVGKTPPSRGGNSSENARWTHLPQLTTEDSQVEPPHTDDEGFEEPVTQGGIGDMRQYFVSKLFLFRDYVDNETCRTSAGSKVTPLDAGIWPKQWKLHSRVHQNQGTNVKAQPYRSPTPYCKSLIRHQTIPCFLGRCLVSTSYSEVSILH